MYTKRSMLITNPEHGDVDEDQHEQGKGDLSLNLNRFQTEGTNVYDFDSYVKVHTVVSETKNDQRNNDRIARVQNIMTLNATRRIDQEIRMTRTCKNYITGDVWTSSWRTRLLDDDNSPRRA